MKRRLYGLSIFIIPVALFFLFFLTTKGFGIHSIAVVLNQTMLPTAMGLGLCVAMLAGMNDLAIGVKVIFGAVVGGMLSKSLGVAGLILGCFGGAMASALVQAALYRMLRIPSMVLSLGIIMIYEVAASLICGAAAYVGIPGEVSAIGSYPCNIIVLLLAGAFFYVVFYHTPVGLQIKAVGSDERLCKSMGVKADRVKFLAYIISAVICGFASILNICYSGMVSVQTNMSTLSLVFKPIMGALIGMQLVRVLDNLPLLVFIGELCIQIIFNGFIAMGLSDAWQNVMLGAFILIIVFMTGDRAPNLAKIRKAVKQRAFSA